MEKVQMRNVEDKNSICEVCGLTRAKSLDMWDMRINLASGGKIQFRICDSCLDKGIFYKSLKAIVHTQGRVKSGEDIRIIQARNSSRLREVEKRKQEGELNE